MTEWRVGEVRIKVSFARARCRLRGLWKWYLGSSDSSGKELAGIAVRRRDQKAGC
jgi:hypothetical protein